MDELSFSLYMPLIVLGVVYGVLFVIAQVQSGRGNRARSERLLDFGFALALLAAAYVVVLLLISLVSMPDLIYDMIVIVVVVGVFFAVLLFVLFGLFELLVSRRPRRAKAALPEGRGAAQG